MNQHEAEDWVARHIQAPYARDLFGIELISAAPGAVSLALPHRPAFEHAPGWFQGGITTALGEYAASYAAATTAEPASINFTIEQTIHFLGPARGQRLIAEGRAIAPGRTITIARSEIFVEEGDERRHCATLTTTMRHAPPKA